MAPLISSIKKEKEMKDNGVFLDTFKIESMKSSPKYPVTMYDSQDHPWPIQHKIERNIQLFR
jgi:hypothetical protein